MNGLQTALGVAVPPNLEVMERTLTLMRAQIAAMPRDAQKDIETFARSFRNQLAAGAVARIALLLVAAENSLETAKKMAERKR